MSFAQATGHETKNYFVNIEYYIKTESSMRNLHRVLFLLPLSASVAAADAPTNPDSVAAADKPVSVAGADRPANSIEYRWRLTGESTQYVITGKCDREKESTITCDINHIGSVVYVALPGFIASDRKVEYKSLAHVPAQGDVGILSEDASKIDVRGGGSCGYDTTVQIPVRILECR